LLVSDFEEASKIAEFNEVAKVLAEKYWPGQLTLILKKKAQNILPPEVTANQDTIGLRVPDNEIVLEILKILKSKGKFGGIIGTSANYSGEEPSVTGAEVAKTFLGTIDLIIDSGASKSKIPTTIVNCTQNKINFLRIGVIDETSINEFLKSKGH
ncbi:MAG TPA: L-threonylcarbamoyladenylate synthase, partial [Candidatus Lokiarchaeia archaeon]